MKKIWGFLFLTQVLALPAHSEHLYVGVGTLYQNLNKTTNSDNASTSFWGQNYFPVVSLAGRFNFIKQLKIMPTLSYTPTAKTGSDRIKKRILNITLPLVLETPAVLELKFGPGIMYYYVGGEGGTTDLSNGTGTATFYRPSTTRHSSTILFDVGAGFRLPYAIRLDADILVADLLSSRRGFNVVAQISKGFL